MCSKRAMAIVVWTLMGCSSVPPSTSQIELFVNFDSGGVWPEVVSARVFEDGTLALGDGPDQQRRRVSREDSAFHELRAALRSQEFVSALRAAAQPSPIWRSSGAWLRLQRGEVVAMIKPPIEQPQIRAVLTRVDGIFSREFGKRYRPVAEVDPQTP
jgi:hypothetical protein